MIKPEEVSSLVSDVHEQLAYYRELGVELLDVEMAEAVSAQQVTLNAEGVSPNVGAIPSELPNAPITVTREQEKPNLKRTSKLLGLPSLSNRASVRTPSENGNAEQKENEIHD